MSNPINPSWPQGFARSASESANPGLWDELLGHWQPSLGPTGLTLHDVSGWGNNGTLTNMDVSTDWVASEKGWTLDTGDSNTEHIDCGSNASLDDVVPMTLAAWVLFGDIEVNGAIVDKRGQFFGQGWQFYVNGAFAATGRLAFGLDSNGAGTDMVGATADGAVSANQWHHVAVTWNGGLVPSTDVQFFVDGSSVAVSSSTTGDGGSTDVGNVLALGGQPWATGNSLDVMDGQIAVASLHNRILSPNEIQQLYVDPHAITRLRRRMVVRVPEVVAAGAIMNQIQYANLGADLYNGTLA